MSLSTPIEPTNDLLCPTCGEDLKKWFALLDCPCGQRIKDYGSARVRYTFASMNRRAK